VNALSVTAFAVPALPEGELRSRGGGVDAANCGYPSLGVPTGGRAMLAPTGAGSSVGDGFFDSADAPLRMTGENGLPRPFWTRNDR